MLQTYVINLPGSEERKNHMMRILAPYPFLRINWIEAVDGRILSDEARAEVFDDVRSYDHMGRRLNGGEVGCTLSHRRCYERIIADHTDYVLILEDDISEIRPISLLDEMDLDSIMSNDRPTILFLSGDYCHYGKHEGVVKVFHAIGSYAYLINRKAASLIVDKIAKPYHVADDWIEFQLLGVDLRAIRPYMIDANLVESLDSEIKQETWSVDRKHMALKDNLISLYYSLVRRLFIATGHFQSKQR